MDIRYEVRALLPQSLLQAFQLTKFMEDRIDETQSIIPKDRMVGFHNSSTTTTFNNSTFINTTQSTQIKKKISIQRLTLNQLDERRAKGLCFHCDEKFHRGCVH